MGERQKRKGELSRTRLLEAALAQFAANGYHVTKVSDIVKAAGLTQAAFYLYFARKEAILTELVDDFKRKIAPLADAGSLVTPLARPAALQQIKENMRNVLQFFNANPEITRIVFVDSPQGKEIKAQITSMITGNLRRNQEAGHLRSNFSIETAADVMLASIEMTITKIIDGEKDPLSLADDVTDILLFGIFRAE